MFVWIFVKLGLCTKREKCIQVRVQLLIIIMVESQALGTAPLPTADHRGGRQVKEVLHPCKGSHRIVSRDGASDLNTKLVDKGGGLGLHAGELNKPKSVAGQTPGGFDDESDKAHKCVHLVAKNRLVPALLLLRADLEGGRQSGQSGDEDAGRIGGRLGAVGESGGVGYGNVDILAPGNIDDACIGASVPGVSFDCAAVTVVLDG